MFHPLTAPNHLDSSFYGFEVPVKHDLEFFKVTGVEHARRHLAQATLLYNLAKASELGLSTANIAPLR